MRKTCISRLLDADIPKNFVAQLSGHKNTESLQSYKSASSTHQRRMSLTLSRARSSSEESTVSSIQDLQMASSSSRENASTSTAVNSMMKSSVDPLLSSTAPDFAGANIGSISGCTFQIFHGNVKFVQTEKSVDLLLKVTTMIDCRPFFSQEVSFSYSLNFTFSNSADFLFCDFFPFLSHQMLDLLSIK